MLNNNNQQAVKRISQRSLKQNQTRNIFAVLAIILTTFMFTTVFSIGFSLAKNMNIMMLRNQGTKAAIFINNPTDEQISQVNQCKHLNAAGIEINAGMAQSINNIETMISLDYYDKINFEENFTPAISNIKGEYPATENEIMLSEAALEALNIKSPELGMDINLMLENKDKTFILSGYFTDYCYTAGGFQGFVSEAYTNSLGLSVQKDGTLAISAKTGSQYELAYEIGNEVNLSEGQNVDTTYDVQDDNGSNIAVIVIAIGLIGLIIMLSGYLLIYNIMYISVTKDIRFYGMLKTIGTSPKQIKTIVKKQAFRLSVIGIPVGTILGTVVSFVAVPYALKMFGGGMGSHMSTDMTFNPFIYIGTILFGILTVSLSCRKPAKLASKVSPVEALKYNGQNQTKIKAKKSTNGGKLYKMAYRNVFREKKRAVLVFASLFMGTMAFLSTNVFISSLKLDNYIDTYLPNDYTIYINNPSNDYGNTYDEKSSQDLIDAAYKLADDIKDIDGITNVMLNRSVDADIVFDENIFRPFIEIDSVNNVYAQDMIDFYNDKENSYTAPVVGVSSQMMEEYNKRARQKIDIDRFEKGEICFMGYVNTQEQSDFVKGKTITLTDNKSGKTVDLEVGVCPTLYEAQGINIGYYWQLAGGPAAILVSDKVLDEMTSNIDGIIADCDPKAESSVTAKIKDLIKVSACVRAAEIKSEMIEDFKTSMTSMNILTAGISCVLILIGLINYINVMLTGVYTRRKELAVMESVGMTKKQIRKMLMLEGLYYCIITIGLILTLGNVIVFSVGKLTMMIADYAVFSYPLGLLIGISAVILAVCMIVPSVVYRTISRESVTERLGDAE